MKILCEIPLKVANYLESQINWLKHNDSLLFVVENGQRLRILNIKQDPIEDVQSASLTESRVCTNCCWNRDNTLLAIVVDKRQIYFWQVKTNTFTQFKTLQQQSASSVTSNGHPASNSSASTSTTSFATRKTRHKDIELVAWSKISDKLAICYATGQILLCRFAKNYSSITEKFIDNSESVLKRIVSIEVADQADLFSCFSSISEILVMTFDGQTKFYIQGDGLNLFNAKFSPKFVQEFPKHHHNQTTGLARPKFSHYSPALSTRESSATELSASICLAYQSKSDGLFFKRISFDNREFLDIKPKLDILHDKDHEDSRLINFFWLSPTKLLACLSTGTILLAQLMFQPRYPQQQQHLQQQQQQQHQPRDTSFSLTWTELLRIGAQTDCDLNQFVGPAGPTSPFSSRANSPPVNEDPGGSQDTKEDHEHVACNTITRKGSLTSLVARSAASTTTSGTSKSPNQVTFREGEPEFIAFDVAVNSSQVSRVGTELECVQNPDGRHEFFAFVAATKYKLFYFELYDKGDHSRQFQFEPVDELDLEASLRRWSLSIGRVSWSNDCSLLAVQLTSGHVLIYRAKLQNHLVAANGSRIAYLSSSSEVTILNYGNHTSDREGLGGSSPIPPATTSSTASTASEPTNENAIILDVGLKPSIIAIGPKHLAAALNNRIRFHALQRLISESSDTIANNQMFPHHYEQEFATIVCGLKLNSSFVAIQFDDGRLKLQPIQVVASDGKQTTTTTIEDERFFPDPVRPETIVAFELTEQLLVYCSKERNIQVFSLSEWTIVQTCEHSHLFEAPISRLKSNEVGNRFICLLASGNDHRHSSYGNGSNVYLYDVFSNQVYSLVDHAQDEEHEADYRLDHNRLTYDQIFQSQLEQTLRLLPLTREQMQERPGTRPTDALTSGRPTGQVLDAIWDTDGRTVLLIERDLVQVVAILNHTLAGEEPVVEFADCGPKPSSYTILYASQGIVSYQTKLGRVINSILATHNDDQKLQRLEQQVGELTKQYREQHGGGDGDTHGAPATNGSTNDGQHTGMLTSGHDDYHDYLIVQWSIMEHKLAYLRTILPLYSLPKCYDICDHLMNDDQFNLNQRPRGDGAQASGLIDQLIWKQLAAWSIYCLNLDFAQLIYRKHNLLVHGQLLANILDDLRWNGLDSRQSIRESLLRLLGLEHGDS